MFKSVYERKSVRLLGPALFLVLMLVAAPNSFGDNTSLSGVYRHVSESLPVPKGVNNMLFYLQRDPDANTVIYQLNIKNGQLDAEEPVNAFWIRYADKGQVKSLSALQRKLAYGITAKQLSNDKHELKFVSYPKLPLYLVKEGAGNDYNVLATIQQRVMVLNRIFVRVKEGSFYLPKVEYIELSGKDSETGKELTHRIVI